MEEGLVSVVMPAYNAERYIARSIASVLEQTYRQLELVVIDDHSTDGTLALADAVARTDSRVRVVRLPCNGGVAAARNAGISAARGDYIAFLDSDDWWHPAKLDRQVALLKGGARISYACYQRVAEDGTVLATVTPPAAVSHADMLKSNHIGNLTGIYDRRLGDLSFRRIGHEDYVFWLEMVRRAGRAHRVEDTQPLAGYLVRKGSVSSDKLKAMRWQWHIYRQVEKLGIAAAGVYLLHYLWHAVGKRRG